MGKREREYSGERVRFLLSNLKRSKFMIRMEDFLVEDASKAIVDIDAVPVPAAVPCSIDFLFLSRNPLLLAKIFTVRSKKRIFGNKGLGKENDSRGNSYRRLETPHRLELVVRRRLPTWQTGCA